MRSHAKASTAGSTQRRAGRLGRIFRGADATRGTSHASKGSSGAPAIGRHGLSGAALLVALLLALGASPALAAGPPSIKEEWNASVVRTEATLKAKINPEELATTFHVEYGTTVAYGSETTESGVGSDGADHIVGVDLTELQPGTTYHWRVVATNSAEIVNGPDRTFTTYAPASLDVNCPNQVFRVGPAAQLPDCRGYEMVSPVDKNGGDIETEPTPTDVLTALNQSAPSGDRITYSSYKSFGDQISGFFSNQYLADRGPSGWMTKGINAPQGTTVFDPIFDPFREWETYFYAFSEDLSSAWLQDFNLTPLTSDAVSGYMNLYRRDNETGSYEALTVNPPLVPTEKTLREQELGVAEVQGVSRDGSHAVIMAKAKLTPEASSTARQIYDYSDGKLRLVNILPDGSPLTEAADLGNFAGGGFISSRRASLRLHAISDDGSRIFWNGGNHFGNGTVYVRIDGERTVQVSAGGAKFWTATPDGSKALYTEGEIEKSTFKLYEFDVDTETRSVIGPPYVLGVLGASEDLSYVYFVSREALGGGTAGKPNLYLHHEGTTTFIATVANLDVELGANEGQATKTSIVDAQPLQHSSRVTPDGRHIAFTSHRSLTGYDNLDASSGLPDKEVYLYEADAERLVCASCNPSGARPVGAPAIEPFGSPGNVVRGNSAGPERDWTAAWLTTSESSNYTSRPLSDDGSHLFFNSFDALVPEDTNGVQDVYQWRAKGAGACDEEEGCISLISTGQSPTNSEFVDATPSGDDVFITTTSSIDPRDPGLIDIYDARVGGGFPPPPPPPPGCEGDGCQSAPPPPNDPTPASAGFRGAGNPEPRKARRSCRARKGRAAKSGQRAKGKQTKRCRRNNRRAGR